MVQGGLSSFILFVLLCQQGQGSPTNLITCESDTALLSCAQGTIKVLSAGYGRQDATTCSAGRPASQLTNTNCLISTPLNVLATRCDGKTSCSVVVANTAFTDPCYGTYKYLNVSYECAAPPPDSPTNLVTCESDTALLSCAQGTIKVLSAGYGRQDATTCSAGRPASQLLNTNCLISTPLNVLATWCDGKTSCSVVADNTAFTDPCYGTYKYLTLSYKCVAAPLPPPSDSTNLVTCESDTALLSCAQGTIKVLSASYGRQDATTCSAGRPASQLSNTNCLISTPLNVLATRCDGKTSCSVVVGNTAFTDPCYGTYKYLTVSYKCADLPPPPGSPTNLVTCESDTALLTCAQGTIKVLSASYGRQDATTCSAGRPASQLSNTNCLISTPLNVLATRCDGKTSCSIVVANTAFTDPCYGTYKYLNVSYKCAAPPPPSDSPTNLVTCESDTALLNCAQGTIKVLSASYGRQDATTCSAGRPASQLTNTNCLISTPLNVLATQCDGKTSCSVVVDNTAFTDPCYGTYKYLTVSYKCAASPPPPDSPTNLVTCESDTALLSCAQGTIKVLSAGYGRQDATTCSAGRLASQLTNTNCLVSTPLNVLAALCDGKTSCSIVVDNTAFTDPCYGTYKYLTVSYKCAALPPPPDSPTNLVACESDTALLSCAQGTIKMLSASYGRQDATTCSAGRPASQLSNTNCLISTPLNVLAAQCDGKTSCSVVADNTAFTDPCYETYKYLTVSYKCADLPPPPSDLPTNLVTCESDTALLSCAQGTIKVLSAGYGRQDATTCSAGRPASQLSNTNCLLSTPLNVLVTQCDGKTSCSVVVDNTAFTDPCYGTYKYLNVSYKCAAVTTDTLIICQDQSGVLSCAKGHQLFIHYANYGRRDQVTCPQSNPSAEASTCISSVTRKLQTRCNNKGRCVIRATNSQFSDRCPQIYKYLEVTYSCEAR